jgi:hypothetical protein
MNALCREPVEARYLDMIRFSHQRDTRTCLASSNRFIQRFRRVTGSDSWVVTDTPTGPCGTVNASRFEKDKSVRLDFWRYYAKKVITNPQGEFLPGTSCTKLDQDEYFYDWRSKDWQLGCDYIEFSPI